MNKKEQTQQPVAMVYKKHWDSVRMIFTVEELENFKNENKESITNSDTLVYVINNETVKGKQ